MGFARRLADALVDRKTNKSRGLAVGITGPWGSGKSSILNLLREHIKTVYPDALVVRFDPWLVSGRNDLISEFMRELIRTINSDKSLQDQFRSIANTLTKYGEYLAPIAATWVPLLGPVIRGGNTLIRDALKSDESLTGLRGRLIQQLGALNSPIVVLIDEVDRVEDDEIRTIAQLVRSIADFPGISYVLAYDPKRVIQALGSVGGDTEEKREERGRAYLEKIVQLQIPLPVTFADEISRLFVADLTSIQAELSLPDNFQSIDRYQELSKLLFEVIGTPRDVGRLIGTFHALAGMVRKEVDWIDLLGYCALLVKAPQTADLLKEHPDEFSSEIISEAGMIRAMSNEKVTIAERLEKLLPKSEDKDSLRRLLGFLFPHLSDSAHSGSSDDRRDALHRRRPLLTVLRLGLIPGDYPRAAIESLLVQSPQEVERELRDAYRQDTMVQVLDRLDDIYSTLPDVNHVRFWQGVGLFLKKPDCEWINSYNRMHEVVQSFSEILERAVLRNPSFQSTATSIFSNLRSGDEDQLTACWLRRQIFLHGLFGRNRRPDNAPILDANQTEATALEMSRSWRPAHLSGKLVPCRWDLMPVYTMLDTGTWDEPCVRALDAEIASDEALDGFTLMLYGANFTTEKETVAKMCSYDAYLSRVRERLKAPNLHETVRAALTKAEGGGW